MSKEPTIATPTSRVYGVEVGIPLDSYRVLVVDDHPFHRNLLAKFLSWGGIEQVDFAADGEEALARVAEFRPDLVLLDVMMPRLDGIEVCRRIRANPLTSDILVLMQTALTSDQQRVSYFQAGATDVVAKPINPGEFISRVRLHLERRAMLQELRAYRRRVETELRMAQRMQAALVPARQDLVALENRYGLSIEACYETSSELGGDYWTAFDLPDGQLGLLMADFSGHGIGAAINTFRLNMLVESLPPEGERPAVWLEGLNHALLDVLPVGQFATAIYLRFDPATGEGILAGAGAPTPWIHDGQERCAVDTSGLFLGVDASASYSDQSFYLPPGGNLLLFSDAMPEGRQRNGHGAMLGEAWVFDHAEQARHRPAGQRLGWLVEQFLASTDQPLRDDLTAVWLSRPA